jgi:hypothetical protein
MRFDVLTALSITVAAFWNMTSCSLVDKFRRFGRDLLPSYTVSHSTSRIFMHNRFKINFNLICLKIWRDIRFYVLGLRHCPFVCYVSRSMNRFQRVLTMVYNTENYRVFGLCPSSGILKAREHNVSETGIVSVQRWRGSYILSWVP